MLNFVSARVPFSFSLYIGILSILFSIKGQMAQFNNFFIALDSIASAKISTLDINLAQSKGQDDSAIVRLDLLIYR